MGHLALTRAILLTFICTATAADTVTSNGKASSCPNEQVKELNIQSSLIQVVSGSHSQTDVAVIAAQEFPEAEEANALEQAIAAGVHIQDLTKITFDCKIGLVHWRGGWSDLKKAYCCRTEHIGCLESTETTEGSPSNVTNVTKSEICVTGKPLINLIGYTTSQAGTPCIFGLDERDENEHCILSDMKYGSMGWCYTSTARDSWGPCSESCPLFGPLKVLGNKVKKLRNKIKELVNLTTAASSNASDSGESAETPAAEEKKEKKEENKGKEEKGEKAEEEKEDKKEEKKEEKKDEKKEEKDKATKAPKPAPKPE